MLHKIHVFKSSWLVEIFLVTCFNRSFVETELSIYSPVHKKALNRVNDFLYKLVIPNNHFFSKIVELELTKLRQETFKIINPLKLEFFWNLNKEVVYPCVLI